MPPSHGSPPWRLLSGPIHPGKVVWIGTRPARKTPILAATEADLVAGLGIGGDHYATKTDGPRQVTLIAQEDLSAIASFLGLDAVGPEPLRRNLVTAGINLRALKARRFRVGPALLEGAGECAPCGQMEVNLGPGGYNAVRGHGGIVARVIRGGRVSIGDAVVAEDPSDPCTANQ